MNPAPLFSKALPTVSLGVPATALLGQDVQFSVTFDNPGVDATDIGYGPFMDVVLDTTGADGVYPGTPAANEYDGLGTTSISASYAGAAIPSSDFFMIPFDAAGHATHPFVVDNTGNRIVVSAPSGFGPGDTLVVVRLPFGSFTPDQPPAAVNFNVNMSNKADLGTALNIQARGGYEFGYTPLNDWCCGDAPWPNAVSSWTSASVIPVLMSLSKAYSGPENETATGPNFPHQYTLTVDIAAGQTIANLNLMDTLPNNMQYVSLASTSPGYTNLSEPSTAVPGGTLTVGFNSVTGSASPSDVTVTFSFYIPRDNALLARVIDPVTGVSATSCNNASISGSWTPIDPRDTGGVQTINPGGCEHTLTDKSIAIQKGVSVVGGGSVKPGAVLEYTLNFQVSDFFAFDGIVGTDIFSDGQLWDGNSPTLQVDGNGFSFAESPFGSGNYTMTTSHSGPTAGSTTAAFNISDEVIARAAGLLPGPAKNHALAGRLLGGCVPLAGSTMPDCGSYNDLGTTATIKFRTIIQNNFTDTYPSGDQSVDQGDTLTDAVTLTGNVLDTNTFATQGYLVTDTSNAGVEIGRGTLGKTIYAVNGSTTLPIDPLSGKVLVQPGDTVTYRLNYSLTTSDVENLRFEDYLPLPVFSVAATAWSFSSAGGIPAPGVVTLGPADTFYAYMQNGLSSGTGLLTPSTYNPGPTVDPVVTRDTDSNFIRIAYGDYNDSRHSPTVVDLLFTVTVSADPFADRMFLTNQARAYEGSTNAGFADVTSIVQLVLTEPALVSKKSVIWTDNPNATFSPTSPAPPVTFLSPASAPRWSGTINSTNLWSGTTHTINRDIRGVDAGDIVSFALVIENQGSSLKGAFDITVLDTLPAQFQVPAGGLNLQIYYGNGTGPITYTRPDNTAAVPADLFGTGIRLVDPVGQGVCSAHDPNLGNNIILITYDLQLSDTVPPGAIVNTSSLTNYAGEEGGPNFLPTPQTDTATTAVVASVAKTLVGTEIVNANNTSTQAVISELLTYQLVLTVPEGQAPGAQLVDTLNGGLAFVDLTSVSVSNPDTDGPLSGDDGLYSTVMTFDALGACTNCTAGTGGGSNPLVQNSGGRLIFDFGTLTDTNRNNAVAETITIIYRAVVLNVISNQAGTNLTNSAVYSWTGGSLGAVSAPVVTVIEPNLTTAKSVLPTTGQAGDFFNYTVTLTNPNGATDADAQDVSWSDSVPAKMDYVASSLMVDPGQPCTAGAPTSLSDAGPLTATWTTFPKNTTCTLKFQTQAQVVVNPGEVITNTAETRWTSYPGLLPGPRSTYNPASVERTGADGFPGPGVLNDYRSSGSAAITIYNTLPQKYLMQSSESFTGGTHVTIGEIVRYRLVVFIPKSTSPNFQVEDVLPAGMIYLNDSTARAAFVSDGGVSSSAYGIVPALVGCNILGSTADGTTPPAPLPCLLANANVGSDNSTTLDTDTYTSGGSVYFKLGTLTNNDNDTNNEYVVIEFNALVDNHAGSGSNFAGKNLDNYFRVFINGFQNDGISNTHRLNVVEPLLSLTKASAIDPSRDAGDNVTYTLTISAAGGASHATAFELNLSDTLDPNLIPGTAVITSTTQGATCVGEGSGTTSFTDAISLVGSVVSLTASCLDPGSQIVATVTATVIPLVNVPLTIPNTASLNWSSLPGDYGTTSNPTGSQVTGAPGSTTGERNGTGPNPPNSYSVSASGPITLASPGVAKHDPIPLQYTIGQMVSYDIWVTLPEGVTRSLVVTDNIPSGTKSGGRPWGLRYVSYSILTSDPSLPASYSDPAQVASPTFACTGSCSTGDDITLTYTGNITTQADNKTNNNTFIVRVVLLVENITGNQDLIPPNAEYPTTLVNSASLTFTGGSASSSAAAITVIEPRITTTKSVLPAANVKAGDTVTYTVTWTNTGHSTAFDVTADDTLAQGIAFNAVSACSYFNGSTTTSIAYTTSLAGNVVSFDGAPAGTGAWDIPATTPNSYIQCVYTGLAQTTMYLDGAHTNTVDADWSSLDGVQAGERVYNDTTSYNFDGAQDTATATFATAAPTLSKSNGGITTRTIGDTIPYTITIGGVDAVGTIRNLVVSDHLPAGLVYNNDAVISSGLPSVVPTVSSPNDGTAPVTVTWNFGDAYKSAASVTITYSTLVAEVPGNSIGTILANTAWLDHNHADNSPAARLTSTTSATITEPIITTSKSVNPLSGVKAGDIVTYTARFTDTGTSTAYETTAMDTLAQGMAYTSLVYCRDQGGIPVSSLVTNLGATITFDGNPVGSWDIAPGNWIECQYTATAQPGIFLDGIHTNTVDADWTSQNGSVPGERIYDDTVNRPGVDGTQDTAQASFNTDSAGISKSDGGVTQAVIGQTVHMTLTINAPLGTLRSTTVVDTLPAGLIYSVGSQSVSAGITSAVFSYSLPNDGSAAVSLTWNFGDAIVSSSPITIQYDAIVANVSGNVDGLNLVNNVSLNYTDAAGNPQTKTSSDSFAIVEPVLSLTKTHAAFAVQPDAGDEVHYFVTLQPTGSSHAPAYDVQFTDTLPADVTLTLATVQTTLNGGAVGATVTDASHNNTVDVTISDVPNTPGTSVVIEYRAILNTSVTPSQLISNTGNLTWTSTLGPNPYERSGTGGALNHYNASASDSFRVHDPAFSKSIHQTDDPFTLDPQVAIGETVTFDLNVTLPEGTTPSLHIFDDLPLGLRYVLGSAQVVIPPGFSGTVPPPVFTPAVGPVNSGDDFTADFTTPIIVNPDGDTTNNAFIVRFQAVVLNESGNQNGGSLQNTATMTYNSVNYTDQKTVDIVEPVLVINKTVNDLFPGPGQVLTFTLTVNHNLLTTSADAFDVLIADDLPAELILNLSSVTVSLGGGASGASDTSSGNRVEVSVADLPQAGMVTVQFQATVSSSVTLGQVISNTADLTWTSMPLSNPDERTGSGGPLNDYQASSTVTLTANKRLTKSLIGDNLGTTSLPQVTIGEILTYQVVINVPAGMTNAVRLTDNLDLGLAFVDCLSITPSSGVTTNLAGGFIGVCQAPVVNVVGDPTVDGRQVTFDLGDVDNSSGVVGTITVQYRVVVLDLIQNQNGVGNLNNLAGLTWTGGTLQTAEAADVSIVEPRLTLVKTADITVAPPGTVITFTLTIKHDPVNSTTDAYDVVLTDVVPAGLVYVPNSLTLVSGIAPTTINGAVGPNLSVVWDYFPLSPGAAVVQFQAALGPLPPGEGVTNTANMEWSTLPGIPPSPPPPPVLPVGQQSRYNTASLERRYDPTRPMDVYLVSSSVTVMVPNLPKTGFAPGRWTSLPDQPAESRYQELGNLWLEIPALGIQEPIVGVPLTSSGWDLTWLWDQVGYLDGTAYPTWSGNSVLTGHVYLSDGQPGPFLNLHNMFWGQTVIVHFDGQEYLYSVRDVRRVWPDDLTVLNHADSPTLTLVTCQDYDQATNDYRYRIAVRAVLIDIQSEPDASPSGDSSPDSGSRTTR